MYIAKLSFFILLSSSVGKTIHAMDPARSYNKDGLFSTKDYILRNYLPNLNMQCNDKFDCPSIWGGYGLCLEFMEQTKKSYCWYQSTAPPTPEMSRLQRILSELTDPSRVADTIHAIIKTAAGGIGKTNSLNDDINDSVDNDSGDGDDEGNASVALINSGRGNSRRGVSSSRTPTFRRYNTIPTVRICRQNDDATINIACDEDWPGQAHAVYYMTGRRCNQDVDCHQRRIMGVCKGVADDDGVRHKFCHVESRYWTYYPRPDLNIAEERYPREIKEQLDQTRVMMSTQFESYNGQARGRSNNNRRDDDNVTFINSAYDNDDEGENIHNKEIEKVAEINSGREVSMPKYIRMCRISRLGGASINSCSYDEDELGRNPMNWLKVSSQTCTRRTECYDASKGGQGECTFNDDLARVGFCYYSVLSYSSNARIVNQIIAEIRANMLLLPSVNKYDSAPGLGDGPLVINPSYGGRQ